MMDAETLKIILALFAFAFSFYSILFAWLFYRTNANHAKSEAVRLENSQQVKEAKRKTEDLRLEYVEKIKDIFEENKEDRKQHNRDMIEMQKSIHEMAITIGDKISQQIEKLNVMPEHHVKEYVDNKLDPLIEGYHEIKKSNKEVVTQVALLLDRSSK